jgi:4-amino-4-deoxy-L-arabinose transferase-like glycosyltransferase
MTLQTGLMIGAALLLLLLLGAGYYAMTLNPRKYRRPRVWLLGTVCIFLLYTVGIVAALGRLDLGSIMAIIVFGLPASVLTALGLWVPMFQRDKIAEWHDSRRNRNQINRRE